MTIPGVFTHINLLHSAVWAVIRPPTRPPPPCDWMPGPVPRLMGAGRGQCEAGNGGSSAPSWWWPAAWKAYAHPSRQSLSSTPRRPGSGCESMSTVCEHKCSLCWGVVKSTLLIAVIIDFTIPVQRERGEEGPLLFGNCVWKGGKAEWVISSFLGEMRLNIPCV